MHFPQDEEAVCGEFELSAEVFRDARDPSRIGARPDPEHGCAALTHEGQAPFRRNRRRRQRLRDGNAETIGLMLLGTTLQDQRVRRGPLAQEFTLPSVRLEQGHLALRQSCGERDTRHATAGADVDDRALELPHDVGAT